MKPGSVYELPTPDKRYKPGKIVKDKKGTYRGHPATVIPKRQEMLTDSYNLGLSLQMNPPIVISGELADHLKKQGLTS